MRISHLMWENKHPTFLMLNIQNFTLHVGKLHPDIHKRNIENVILHAGKLASIF